MNRRAQGPRVASPAPGPSPASPDARRAPGRGQASRLTSQPPADGQPHPHEAGLTGPDIPMAHTTLSSNSATLNNLAARAQKSADARQRALDEMRASGWAGILAVKGSVTEALYQTVETFCKRKGWLAADCKSANAFWALMLGFEGKLTADQKRSVKSVRNTVSYIRFRSAWAPAKSRKAGKGKGPSLGKVRDYLTKAFGDKGIPAADAVTPEGETVLAECIAIIDAYQGKVRALYQTAA